MAESFRCPSCSAPLEFEGKPMQKCRFCGSNVIVPAGVIQSSTAFGASGALDFGDLSSLRVRALKIAEIQRNIQSGNKINAIKIFRETFGTGLKEAKDAVEAMERGESVDISGMQIKTAPVQTNFSLNAQNLQTAKKIGIAFGSSIIGVTILSIILVLGAIIAVFYIMARSLEKTIPNASNTKPPVTKPEATPPAREILKFGGEGTGAGRFKDNRSVAVDPGGRIYSCDFSGGRVQVFDAGGKFLTQWNADTQGAIRDLKADRKGKIYIVKSLGIFVFEGETGRLLQKAENIRAGGLALTLDGRIIATVDKGITIFDADLKPLQEFKDAAERANAVFNFEHLAVDGNGIIYTLDRQNGDLCKFSADGKFLNRYKTGSSSPSAIAIDNKGRIFVAGMGEIKAFDTDGKQINSFRESQVFGIAFNDADELFVASRPFVVKYKLNF